MGLTSMLVLWSVICLLGIAATAIIVVAGGNARAEASGPEGVTVLKPDVNSECPR